MTWDERCLSCGMRGERGSEMCVEKSFFHSTENESQSFTQRFFFLIHQQKKEEENFEKREICMWNVACVAAQLLRPNCGWKRRRDTLNLNSRLIHFVRFKYNLQSKHWFFVNRNVAAEAKSSSFPSRSFFSVLCLLMDGDDDERRMVRRKRKRNSINSSRREAKKSRERTVLSVKKYHRVSLLVLSAS